MKKYLTVDEFVRVLSHSLQLSLEKDFGTKEAHVVDLLSMATTEIEAAFHFMYTYSTLNAED